MSGGLRTSGLSDECIGTVRGDCSTSAMSGARYGCRLGRGYTSRKMTAPRPIEEGMRMDRERALQWCERLTQAGYPALPVEHHDGDIVTWKVAVEARVSTWASRDNVRLEVRADF